MVVQNQPLISALGEDLAGWFVWVDAFATADWRRVHVYQHLATRRFIYIDGEDGMPVAVTAGRRSPLSWSAAVEQVLPPGDCELVDSDHVAALRSAAERADRGFVVADDGRLT